MEWETKMPKARKKGEEVSEMIQSHQQETVLV